MPIDIIIEIVTFGIVVAGSIALLRAIAGYLTVRRRLGQEATAGAVAPILKPASSVMTCGALPTIAMEPFHRSGRKSDRGSHVCQACGIPDFHVNGFEQRTVLRQ